MKLLELIVDKIKELPGVGYVFFLVTWAGAKVAGVDDLAGFPLAAAAAACALAYYLGSKLDEPVYDTLYGPNTKWDWLPGHRRLSKSRDEAAASLFAAEGFGVKSFEDAVRLGYVGEGRNLYGAARNIVKASPAWEEEIALAHDISKAARSLLIVAFLAACTLTALSYLLPPVGILAGVPAAVVAAGLFGKVVLYVAVIPVSFGLYIYLRVVHQARLYEYLSKHLQLIKTHDDKFVPMLPTEWPGLLKPNAAPAVETPPKNAGPEKSSGDKAAEVLTPSIR